MGRHLSNYPPLESYPPLTEEEERELRDPDKDRQERALSMEKRRRIEWMKILSEDPSRKGEVMEEIEEKIAKLTEDFDRDLGWESAGVRNWIAMRISRWHRFGKKIKQGVGS